jgi:hypothetical protein
VSRSRVALVIGAILAIAAGLIVAAVVLRPTSMATTTSGLAVTCAGIGDGAACAAWAEAVLADGPGIHTFDPEDLERVRLGRSVFDAFGDCQAEYFVERFGTEAVARETVPCPGA